MRICVPRFSSMSSELSSSQSLSSSAVVTETETETEAVAVGREPHETTLLITQSRAVDDDDDVEHGGVYKYGSSTTIPQKHKQKPNQNQNQNQNQSNNQIYDTNDNTSSSLWMDEFWSMLFLALPVSATYLLEMFPGIAATMIVGHIMPDDERNVDVAKYLDATAMAVMFTNITGLSLGLGLSTALDTLCSQAFGARTPQKMGLYAQTGGLVLSSCLVIVTVLFFYAGDILVALGQPKDVSRLAGTFVWYLLPGIPFIYGYELIRKVLQAQNIAQPMVVTALLANGINIGVGYWFVYHTDYSYLGAAIGLTCNYVSLFVLVVPYLAWSGITKVFWNGWHFQEAIRGVPEFLRLGIPGMLQFMMEWWAFELIGLACGLFPNAREAIGANAIVMNVTSMTYMIVLGVSIAGTIRIGNALGANDAPRAKVAAHLTLGMALFCSSWNTVGIFVFRNTLVALFTKDAGITKLAGTLFTVIALGQIPDAITASVWGIFRGMGWQTRGAYLNFAAYYIIGLPVGCVLAFWFEWNVIGMWIGLLVGVVSIAVYGTSVIVRCDWNTLTNTIPDRLQVQAH